MATVDNSTQIIISTESGTGWSVDVTNANLDPLLTLKDFIVRFDGAIQNNVDFTKTSVTVLTYNGVALGSPTEVVIARDTPNDRVKCLTFGDRLQSAEYEAEFNRVHKLINENEISGSDNVKVTVADTTPGTLEDKIIEGADVFFSVINPGGNEQLQISVSDPTSEPYVDINSVLLVPNAVGTDAIAIGGNNTADGTSSIVLGTNSLTDNADFPTDNCIAIGNGATINPTPTTGSDSSDSIAIGTSATVTDATDAIAIGPGSDVGGDEAIVIGHDATANGTFAVCLGRLSSANVVGAVTIGYQQSNTTGSNAILIGQQSANPGNGAVVIGNNSDNVASNNVSIGNLITATSGGSGVAIGQQSTSLGDGSISIGNLSNTGSGSQGAIALGERALAINADAVSIARDSEADGVNSIAIGCEAIIDNTDFATEGCIAIGGGATIDPTPTTGAASSDSIAIGTGASVTDAINAIAIGNTAASNGIAAIAIGNTAEADFANCIAIGDCRAGGGTNAIAIGVGADAVGSTAVAIGANAITNATGAIQIGAGTNAVGSSIQFLTETIANAFGLQAKTVAGVPTDAAADGTLQVDTTNDDLYFRSSSAWQLAGGGSSALVNQDITSGVDITVTPGVSNDRLFITPTANINLILLTAGAANTTHFTFVNLDPGTFNIDVKIDLVGNPTELTLGGGITNISVGYTGTDYRFYG